MSESNDMNPQESNENEKKVVMPEGVLLARLNPSFDGGLHNLYDPEVITALDYHGADLIGRYLLNKAFKQLIGLTDADLRDLWAIVDNQAEPIPPRKSFKDLCAVTDEPQKRLVEHLLPYGGFSILGSSPKTGKSMLIKNLIAAMLTQGPWLGRSISLNSGVVVYYILEEAEAETRSDLQALGVLPHEERLFLRAGRIPVDEFIEVLKWDIEELRPDLILLDPLVDVLNTESINDYGLTNRALKNVVVLARTSGAHILATHHTTKSGGANNESKAYLGSTALPAATDCNMTLSRRSDGTRIFAAETRYRTDRGIEDTTLEYDPETGRVWLGDPVEDVQEMQRHQFEEDFTLLREALSPQKLLSRKDLEDVTGLSQKRVEKILAEAKKRGVIDASGKSHNTRYFLV